MTGDRRNRVPRRSKCATTARCIEPSTSQKNVSQYLLGSLILFFLIYISFPLRIYGFALWDHGFLGILYFLISGGFFLRCLSVFACILGREVALGGRALALVCCLACHGGVKSFSALRHACFSLFPFPRSPPTVLNLINIFPSFRYSDKDSLHRKPRLVRHTSSSTHRWRPRYPYLRLTRTPAFAGPVGGHDVAIGRGRGRGNLKNHTRIRTPTKETIERRLQRISSTKIS
ncbi:hypothetical protein FN846DRAFT_699537 [Sphaerosporella brunnea]|uniref:Uncharacterized protein n=1 Tax=Sphaerosporella brunnea TaxID=1250544 RepID=A0A5J5EYB4_9PEZI|nr:hypothetical protein FN846DRAFT_699537 [Sphaerosporella brunnea]